MEGTNDLRVTVRRGIAFALSTSVALAQWTPQWRQFGPIGPFQPLGAYEDVHGAFVVLGGYSSGMRSWRWLGDWQETTPDTTPSIRRYPGITYDPVRGVAVLFGGEDQNHVPLAETWEFDGSTWTLRAPPHAPAPRSTVMCYDLSLQRCVLVGGWTQWAGYNDTWLYDGIDWTQVPTPTSTPFLFEPSLCYDPANARCLLVGAAAPGPGAPNETWAFDGLDWQQLTTAHTPPSRSTASFAYDSTRQAAVLHGGRYHWASPPILFEDTWVFDGSDWSQATTTTTPPGRWHPAVAYHSAAQGVVVLGGGYYDGTIGLSAAAHVFDGGDWVELQPDSTLLRIRPKLAFDAARGVLVLHGGNDGVGNFQRETWEWRAGDWQLVVAATGPGANASDLVYDPRQQRIVAIDGSTTWQYDANGWSAHTLSPSPNGGSICYDRHAGAVRVVASNRVWTFDGAAWSSITTIGTAPSGAGTHAAHWSAQDRIAALVDDSSLAGLCDGIAWTPAPAIAQANTGLVEDVRRGVLISIDRATPGTALLATPAGPWQLLPPGPADDLGTLTVVADGVHGRVFGVNANGNVWQLTWPTDAWITRFGRGCPGSFGTPSLDGIGQVMPRLGQAVPLRLTSLPLTPGLGLLAFGDSIVSAGGMPLPTPLDALGLPVCAAWIPVLATSPFVHAGAQVSLAPTLPNAPALQGALFALQAFVLDPAATNGLGSVSNAVLVIPR